MYNVSFEKSHVILISIPWYTRFSGFVYVCAFVLLLLMMLMMATMMLLFSLFAEYFSVCFIRLLMDLLIYRLMPFSSEIIFLYISLIMFSLLVF